MPTYTITLQSIHMDKPHELREHFEGMKEAREFCRERYRFLLLVKVKDEIVVDNSEYFKQVNKLYDK